MDFGDVLKRSWDITWKNKALWLLGILASCSGGGGGGGSGGGQAGGGFRGYSFESGEFPELERWLERIPPETITAIVLALGCLALLVALLAIVLGALGQAGLIAGFDLADAGHPITLSEAFRRGLKNFWKILAIQFIVGVLVLLVGATVALGGGLFAVGTLGLGLICLLPLVCLMVPVMFLVGVYVMLAQVAVVVEDLGLLDAFQRGWEIFRAHLGSVIVMALILILGGGLVGLILALPLLLIAVPAVFGLLLGGEGQISTGVLVSGLCFVGLLPLLILLNGILQTFVTGAWTLTFRRLAASPKETAPPALPAA